MTYYQFVSRWMGKFVDYDHAYGNQCVDLIRQYCQDVLGVNGYTAIPPTGNAKDIFANFQDNQYFKKVLNTPNNMPSQGAILFFKNSIWFPFLFGQAGHTGVVDSADLYNIVLFNQNYPTGSACKMTKFKYTNCLGWLARK